MVWATGGALSLVLVMAATVLIVILAHGLTVFWPHPIVLVRLQDGRELLGQIASRQTNPDTHAPEIRLKTANRNFEPDRQDFHWVLDRDIVQRSQPAEVYILERATGGDFYGFLRGLKGPEVDSDSATASDHVAADQATDRSLQAAIATVQKKFAAEVRPINERTSEIGEQLHTIDLEIGRLEYRKRQAGTSASPDQIAIWNAQIGEYRDGKDYIGRSTDNLVSERTAIEKRLRENIAQFADVHGKVRDIVLCDILRAYQPNAMGIPAKTAHYDRPARIEHRRRTAAGHLRHRELGLHDGPL